MKTAIFIRDGVTQYVLTPETDAEQKLVNGIVEGTEKKDATIYKGSFYECRGGWTRYDARDRSDQSLIVVVRDHEEPTP